MCRYKVIEQLIFSKLDSVSINKFLVTEIVTVKVSQKFDVKYVFSKVIECLEQNI